MYGIYNTLRKQFQFGICELTPEKAMKRLFEKIGKDAYKWRFEVRRLPSERGGESNEFRPSPTDSQRPYSYR